MKLRLALLAIIVTLAGTIGIHRVRAAAQQALPTPCVVLVPSDWGEFKGISRYGLAFEDKVGTLRLIEQMPCSLDRGQVGVPRVSIEIRRR
jgi:hypothetical protein